MSSAPVLVLTTGGTFDTVYADGELTIGEPPAPWMLANARAGELVRVESVLAKDSAEITDDDRELLLEPVRDAEAAAVLAAQLLSAGVHVVMNGRAHRAGAVAKDRARGVFVPR